MNEDGVRLRMADSLPRNHGESEARTTRPPAGAMNSMFEVMRSTADSHQLTARGDYRISSYRLTAVSAIPSIPGSITSRPPNTKPTKRGYIV